MKTQASSKSNDGGFAIVIVMVLLVLMAAIIVSNNFTLRQLKRDIDLIEKRQRDRIDAETLKPHKKAEPTKSLGTKSLHVAWDFRA